MNSNNPTVKAIVVGATGGIGQSVCELISAAQGEAFLIGRNLEPLRVLADKYDWGCAVADGSNWEQLESAVATAESVLGGINAAINLAGSVLFKPMHLTTRDEWNATLDANLSTAAGLIKSCAPRMFLDGGSIVLTSSAAASIGLSNHEAIAASKGAIEGLVRSAAATYAPKRIRVNAVAPGLVRTSLTEGIWNHPRAAQASLSMHPIGRLGEADDIARAIVWFAMPNQSWVTGQILGVDGGLSRLKRPSNG